MTLPTTLWALNFDAEIELDRAAAWLAAGRRLETFSHTSTKAVRSLSDDNARRFAALLPQNAIILSHDDHPAVERRGVGLCWCPTPSAVARLQRAGATVGDVPKLEVLARVNHRRFCADLGQPLGAAQFVTSWDEMNELLATPSPTGEWLCKRPFSFAGRGQRRMAAGTPTRSQLSADNQRWLQESVSHGGLQIEPSVALVAEFSLHGLVRRNAPYTLGQVCQQYVDQHGAWSHSAVVSSETASCPLSAKHHQQLIAEAERIAKALAEAEYFGPFSVDSYLWQDTKRALQLNPRSEINARLTMAYPIGMGARWVEDLLLVGSA
jgi:hypothetical protein